MKKLVIALAAVGALALATPALAGHYQAAAVPAVYHSSYGGPAHHGPGFTYASGYNYVFPGYRGYYGNNPGRHRGHYKNHRSGFPFFWGRSKRGHDHSRCYSYGPWGRSQSRYSGYYGRYPYYGAYGNNHKHGHKHWKHNKNRNHDSNWNHDNNWNHDHDGDRSRHHRRHDR